MNINIMTWYAEREMTYCPEHFVPTKTSITGDSMQWILEKCTGRFYLYGDDLSFLYDKVCPYFEDPQEAVLYELTWS